MVSEGVWLGKVHNQGQTVCEGRVSTSTGQVRYEEEEEEVNVTIVKQRLSLPLRSASFKL